MRIVNIMFAGGSGGVEQAFVDYCEGLNARGHQLTAIISHRAAVEADLKRLSVPYLALYNLNEWDFVAMWRLRRRLKMLRPDVIIAHSNRAYVLAKWATLGQMPMVGVAQNYSTRRFRRAKAMFTTTHDLVEHLVNKRRVAKDRVFHIPNMIKCEGLPPHRESRNNPPVIGSMGRFVAKKGFDFYVEALHILKERGYAFKAILGGSGESEKALKRQAEDAGLGDILTFPGWVKDKQKFYSGIDIFCLPSLHEPFGIVLLEAFTFGAPMVSTDSEGPRDIITPNHDALIVKKGDATALADALARLLDDASMANDFAANAFVKVKTRYSMEVVCERIEQALKKVVIGW